MRNRAMKSRNNLINIVHWSEYILDSKCRTGDEFCSEYFVKHIDGLLIV